MSTHAFRLRNHREAHILSPSDAKEYQQTEQQLKRAMESVITQDLKSDQSFCTSCFVFSSYQGLIN